MRFAKQTIRGYYQEDCVECGKLALYHCGGDGYCQDHRQIAVQRRIASTKIKEMGKHEFEQYKAESDDRLLSRQRRRKLRR